MVDYNTPRQPWGYVTNRLGLMANKWLCSVTIHVINLATILQQTTIVIAPAGRRALQLIVLRSQPSAFTLSWWPRLLSNASPVCNNNVGICARQEDSIFSESDSTPLALPLPLAVPLPLWLRYLLCRYMGISGERCVVRDGTSWWLINHIIITASFDVPARSAREAVRSRSRRRDYQCQAQWRLLVSARETRDLLAGTQRSASDTRTTDGWIYSETPSQTGWTNNCDRFRWALIIYRRI